MKAALTIRLNEIFKEHDHLINPRLVRYIATEIQDLVCELDPDHLISILEDYDERHT